MDWGIYSTFQSISETHLSALWRECFINHCQNIYHIYHNFKALRLFVDHVRFMSALRAHYLRNKLPFTAITVNMEHSVLIVEDEKIVREGLARALSRSYKTYQAGNGKEAIEIISRISDIRVIVSDLKMPEVDGFELLDQVRKSNNKVDVIFITAFFSVESAVDAMKKGAFDYMTKPVDIRKLETTIQKAITGK